MVRNATPIDPARSEPEVPTTRIRTEVDRIAQRRTGDTRRGDMTRNPQRGTRKRRTNRPDQWLGPRETDRIRPGRVLAARARIASGHYERTEVKDFLLDALLEELRRH